MGKVIVNDLALCVQNGGPGCKKAFKQLRDSVKRLMWREYRRLQYGGLHEADFDDLSEKAMTDALITYNSQWAFTTWVVRHLVYACRTERRQRRKTGILIDVERLEGVIRYAARGSESNFTAPMAQLVLQEEQELVKQALQQERPDSRNLVKALVKGDPPLKDAARLLNITYANARQTRSRNIKNLARALSDKREDQPVMKSSGESS